MTGLQSRVVVTRRGFSLDAELDAGTGETVAVMGPSGAGKSTLLEAIAGLVRVRDGFVRVGDREVSSAAVHIVPQKRGTVLLGQDPQLFPHLSARENVAFGLRAHGRSRVEAAREANEWLERVGLVGYGDRAPKELSGGQQQRVALARALATRPGVLLLDEPLSALDPETAAGIRGMLAEQLPAAAATTVFVTHDVVDAAALADRLVLLEEGRIAQAGSVRHVLNEPATAFGATIAGVNRVPGRVSGGVWAAGALRLPTSVTPLSTGGSVNGYISPGAVALSVLEDQPAGPGQWVAHILRLEATVAGVRVHVAGPDLAIDVPAALAAELQLAVGTVLRLHVAPEAVRLVAV